MLALQALCLFDALGDEFAAQLDEFLHDRLVHHDLSFGRLPPPEVLTFARTLAEGTWRHRQRYDELLNRAVPQWPVERVSPVDRNVLRLGLHELLEHPETPPQVVINEAIELARAFAATESPAFVNGVLDAIRRDLGIAPHEAHNGPV